MDVKLDSTTNMPYSTTLNKLAFNPIITIIVAVVIIAYYAFFSTLEVSSTPSAANTGIVYMELMLWSIFVLLILLNGMSYLFDIDVTASIKNLFTAEPLIDVRVDTERLIEPEPVPEITYEKQVFHIPNNKYDYKDAEAICKAYGARLATWKDMSNAYKKGADWCSYGWSDGQLALYPTQYDKWDKLQKIKGHEHDCGRPGINGGYIKNPNVRFGVNCYGYKPEITPEEAQTMADTPLYPITKEDQEFDKRVDYWREQLPEIKVAPFNHNNWSGV